MIALPLPPCPQSSPLFPIVLATHRLACLALATLELAARPRDPRAQAWYERRLRRWLEIPPGLRRRAARRAGCA